MSLSTLILLAVVAAVFCALLVPIVRRLAIAAGALDVPAERSIHDVTTPRMGGLAVLGAFTIAVGIGAAMGLFPKGASPELPAFFAGALLVVAIGVVDDMHRLRPAIKLAVEILAAFIVVTGGGCRFEGVSGPSGVVDLGALAIPFTVLWIVLVTNAVNLVDGIDGLAAGTTGIALVAVAIIAYGFELPGVALLAVILAGACVGFLYHNFHPATIFLGDSGSLFIGFTLGVLSTYARAKGTTGAITLATVLIVALPLGDAFWAVERRYVKGLTPHSLRSHLAGLARIFRPDRNHLHHRLLRAGLGQRTASYALYGIQAIACATAVYLLVRG